MDKSKIRCKNIFSDERILSWMERVYQNSVEKGFHDHEYTFEHDMMLIITELSEAVDAHRNLRVGSDSLAQEMHTNFRAERKSDIEMYESKLKDTVHDELADVFIRAMDLMAHEQLLLASDVHDTCNKEEKGPILEAIKIIGWENQMRGETFPAQIFEIIRQSALFFKHYDCLKLVMNMVCAIANLHDCPLDVYIELKMEYNRSRPRLHNKAY